APGTSAPESAASTSPAVRRWARRPAASAGQSGPLGSSRPPRAGSARDRQGAPRSAGPRVSVDRLVADRLDDPAAVGPAQRERRAGLAAQLLPVARLQTVATGARDRRGRAADVDARVG